jgi:hypothetical protein
MFWTDEVSREEDELGNKVDIGDYYFYYNDTTNYFPSLKFNTDWVPLGSPSPTCVHLDWIQRDRRKMYDMYKTVKGFPKCYEATNPKYRW